MPSSTAKTASSNYPNQNSVAAAAGSSGGGAVGGAGAVGGVGAPANMGSPYYRDMDEPTSPAGGGHHRSRSASRPPISHSMDYPSTFCRCEQLIASSLNLFSTTFWFHLFDLQEYDINRWTVAA